MITAAFSLTIVVTGFTTSSALEVFIGATIFALLLAQSCCGRWSFCCWHSWCWFWSHFFIGWRFWAKLYLVEKARTSVENYYHPFLDYKNWNNWNDHYCTLSGNRNHLMNNQQCIWSIHRYNDPHIVPDLKLLWLLVPVLWERLLLVRESYSLIGNEWF